MKIDIKEEDLNYFVELLSYHESEIIQQLSGNQTIILRKALEEENKKCVDTTARILDAKEFSFDLRKACSDFDSLIRNVKRNHVECSMSAIRSLAENIGVNL